MASSQTLLRVRGKLWEIGCTGNAHPRCKWNDFRAEQGPKARILGGSTVGVNAFW